MAWTMPFGKHYGEDLEDVPTSYLLWMMNSDFQFKTADFQEAVEEELDSRGEKYRKKEPPKARSSGSHSSYSPPPPTSAGMPKGIDRKDLHRVIDAGRQHLAKRLHPDVGGSTEEMQKVNMAADYLKSRF